MKAPRWLLPFGLAALLGWWISRPSGPSFMRLPGGGFPAAAWQMPDLEGRMVSSTNFAGQVVVLNFWATWCPPCVQELPELESFYRAQQTNGVVVIGASTDESGVSAVAPFVAARKLTYPVLLAGTNVQESFAVSALPTTIIIGRDGRVAARYLGSLTEAELTRAVTPLVNVPVAKEPETGGNPTPEPPTPEALPRP